MTRFSLNILASVLYTLITIRNIWVLLVADHAKLDGFRYSDQYIRILLSEH
jgi:hypothetical protein